MEMQIQNQYAVAELLESIARVNVEMEDGVLASKLLGAAATIREKISSPVPPRSHADHKRMKQVLRQKLGEKRFEKIFNEGKKLSMAEAAKYALRGK